MGERGDNARLSYPAPVIALLFPWLVSGCGSSCLQPDACDEPLLWYSPVSDEVVHWGCKPPAADWRSEPFIEEVGVDLDGKLRGPLGRFVPSTGDTGLGELGPLDLRGWVTTQTGDTSGLGPLPPTGGTADTYGEIPGWSVDTWDTGFADTGSEAASDESDAAAEEEATDTGVFDTGAGFDTAPTGDTGTLRETGHLDTAPTGDTSPLPETGDTAQEETP